MKRPTSMIVVMIILVFVKTSLYLENHQKGKKNIGIHCLILNAAYKYNWYNFFIFLFTENNTLNFNWMESKLSIWKGI